MPNYASHTPRRQTPQSEPATRTQVKNSAGGYTFEVDMWGQLDRWLILGGEGGTYYASERKITRDNAATVERCLDADGARAVKTIAQVSGSGRAPKNDPAIFALALACAHPNKPTRQAAMAAIPLVCRTGTHLFNFATMTKQLRGWGRGLRHGIASWYTGKLDRQLAYQAVKYQARGGYSHRDLLRLAHPKVAPDSPLAPVLRWIVTGEASGVPKIIEGWEAMKACGSSTEAVKLIREYGLTREMVRSEYLTDPHVWAALLAKMPMGAMVRNLGNMAKVGLLTPMSDASRAVAARLGDKHAMTASRLHPLALLVALTTYRSGRGVRGSGTWTPVQNVIDALDEAFYLAFGNVPATHARRLIALDVSGSMSCRTIAGLPGITPRVASAAMSMVTLRAEPNCHTVAFSGSAGWNANTEIKTLPLSGRQRLDDVVRTVSCLDFGSTDCSLPMLWALENNVEVDAIEIYTDNETWSGRIHPHQALEQYRQRTGLRTKLVVVGMTATGFTIANPDDPGMLDVVGFDVAAPSVMSDFISGGGSKT